MASVRRHLNIVLIECVNLADVYAMSYCTELSTIV